MTMQFVFIRHGIAEDVSSDHSDFSRNLTKKGIQKLEQTLPQLLPLLKGGPGSNREKEQDFQIWSSPRVRALQTAQIAADVFHINQIQTYDFIDEGYFNGFLHIAEDLDPAADHTIIVVGHNPHMGYWSEVLCGACLPFKKGAAAGFLYHAGDPEAAELQWFLQPEAMTKLAEKTDTSSMQILDSIREVILAHAHQMNLERAAFLASPDDPETVHQLRVSIRKLRALLSFFKPYQKEQQNEHIQNVLRKTVKEFSYLRELDVLSAACVSYMKENAEEKPVDAMIQKMLTEQRELEARRIIGEISSSGSSDALIEIEKGLQEIAWKQTVLLEKSRDKNEWILKQMNSKFAADFEEFERASETVIYEDAKATHAHRIEAKKLRYILLSLDFLTDNKFSGAGARLKSVHDTLGELCDARRNKDILQKFNKKDIPESNVAAKEYHEGIQAIEDYQDRVIGERLGFLISAAANKKI